MLNPLVASGSCEVAPSRSRTLDILEFTGLAATLTAVPLLFHDSQFFTGTIVNAALAMGALHLTCRYRLAALVLLPASAALAGASFLGKVSPGLLLLMVAIWAANVAYVVALRRGRANYPVALITATAVKGTIMTAAIGALVAASMLPSLFFTVIAPTAILTALLGGAVARGIDMAFFQKGAK